MKKIAIILAGLAILGIGAYYAYDAWRENVEDQYNFSTWKKFTPRSKLFEVYLPNPPQYGKDYLSISNSDKKKRYDMYASEKLDGTLFLVTVISYPADYDTTESLEVLRQNISELMQNKESNHLNKLWQNIFQEHNSLDFSFENKDFRVEGRSIHDGHIVYMLSYITKKENFDPDEFSYFVDSFKILKQSKEVVKQQHS